MNNKIYDVLKYLFFFGFPALSFLWGVIYVVWNIPYGEQISITIAGVQTALGIALGLTNVAYNKKIGEKGETFYGNSEESESNHD